MTPNFSSRPGNTFTRAGLLASKMPDNQEKNKREREMVLDSAIYAALIDKNDEGQEIF